MYGFYVKQTVLVPLLQHLFLSPSWLIGLGRVGYDPTAEDVQRGRETTRVDDRG